VRVVVEKPAMSCVTALVLAVAVGLLVYLVVALLYPEKFL
jgi:K+-transporting ATPase KdpF subunit